MTEDRWLKFAVTNRLRFVTSMSARKVRLYAVACCRALGTIVEDDVIANALDAVERFAETERSKAELKRQRRALAAFRQSGPTGGPRFAAWCVQVAATENIVAHTSVEIESLGESFGNIDHRFCRRHFHLLRDMRPEGLIGPLPVFAPSWRTETAVSLADGIYADRAFDRLPILADALEEAGCDSGDVLSHCRGPGPHARGCWVVDGVLGKV